MCGRNSALTCFGIFVPTVLPCMHLAILYRWWTSYKRRVDKELCSCSCWDTIFKGTYQETEAPGYKHLYFNVTWQSFLIWFATVVFVILLYECTKYLLMLAYIRKLSYPMASVLLAFIYPHYYTWWSYVNMWNDDFYAQFYHQLVFSFTELLSTALILPMCDKTRPVEIRHLVIILVISAFHISASAYDQFLQNVLWNHGEWHQFVRDIGFMAADILTLIISSFTLWKVVPEPRLSFLRHMLTLDECMIGMFLILVFWFVIVFS